MLDLAVIFASLNTAVLVVLLLIYGRIAFKSRAAHSDRASMFRTLSARAESHDGSSVCDDVSSFRARSTSGSFRNFRNGVRRTARLSEDNLLVISTSILIS